MLKVAHSNHLGDVLQQLTARDAAFAPIATLIHEIADAAIEMADAIALGTLNGDIGAAVGEVNGSGDAQKKLDVIGNEIFINALRRAPVSVVLSEELDEPLVLDPEASLAVAMDPLDGSSNINANVTIGTIFSVLPLLPERSDPKAHFLQQGRNQLAAGFVIYGPQTAIVLAAQGTTQIFILDRRMGVFVRTQERADIPPKSKEYAINASNYRHWAPSVRAFIDDCVKGKEGPIGQDQNMRWVASLVAEAYRILARGGVFLYPGDLRQGYSAGRLRLVYEANPIGLIIEYAGGSATDCALRILDVVPTDVHARTPFVFGSADVVHLVTRYHTDPQFSAEHSPLFGRRGLMRF
jgi:fructose-1,6-bisphosphatase I